MSIPTRGAALLFNDPSQARKPRILVRADGMELPGVIDAEILSNNHYAADRFRVRAALSAAPGSAASWAEAADTLVEILVSVDGGGWSGGWASLLRGAVDTVQMDWARGTLLLCGRDLTAALIEARTQETFANRTSSEIAEILAARHGLDADVQATTTLVGRYWQMEHDRITLNQFGRATTEWDLLVTLAQHEGFDVWVSGTTLHFRPMQAAAAPQAVLRPMDVIDLQMERTLTLARDIEVTVKSWNSRQNHSFEQTARATGQRGAGGGGGTGGGGGRGNVQRYVYVVPNLTPDDALHLAQRKLAELTRHERVIMVEMPGELGLTPRMQMRLEGTLTAFDQIYWIDEIERHVSMSEGFTQRLRARNATVGSQSTSPADLVVANWTSS